MPVQISKTAELIAGYSLQDRIGSGGYGEVWKAEAPGGLAKAIKFIYGRFDEERASTELKALHRIKEVRHPFLLSLERIEVIDGQLVIVTELAEASLNDRFEACRTSGLPGIPREELLLYLHDAADALDYMSKQFSLQHLDIKPENLLIVGGRVKVADFGLVKDIQEATVSLLGGMTPVYAAPEVFDGHPTLQSDQYSLAIVYQEMLSGILPFPGKTPAQLTSQHLHGHPRLTPVPAGDRPILTRALSKNPLERYENCRDLIEALQKAENSPSLPAAARQPPSPARQVYRTVTLSVAESSNDTEAQRKESLQISDEPVAEPSAEPRESINSWEKTASVAAISEAIAAAGEQNLGALHSPDQDQEAISAPEPLPPPDFQNLPSWEQPFAAAELRPTFILGAGGTAARVVRQLQQRWQDRFENLEEVPIFQSLLLDTDPKNLEKVSSASNSAERLIETQLLTLQKPEDYREQSEQLFHWLGRRWLYNIPRSLRTEGLRPLGRLAFVDHAKKVTEHIRKALKTITSPASIESSAKKAKLPISEPAPMIYLIASISGGTGSGMILDLAYAVRQVLAEEGIVSARICGILMHGTSRHANPKKLAVANSYACLRELYAYERNYPGETACGIPPAEEGRGPFDDAYFVDLGDDLGDAQLDAATGNIAEYVYLDTTTACRGFFAQCRTTENAESSSPPVSKLRTLGLSRLGFTPDDIPAADIELLCRNLLDHWSVPAKNLSSQSHMLGGMPAAGSTAEPTPAKAENHSLSPAAKKLLDFDFLGNQVEELVHDQIHSSDENALQETLDKTYKFQAPSTGPDSTVARVQQTLDVLFASVQSLFENNRAAAEAADESIIVPLRTLATAEGTAIGARIFDLLENSKEGLAGLMEAIDEVLRELHQRECDACSRQDRLREIIAQAEVLLASEVAAEKKSWFRRLFSEEEKPHMDECWNDYARWRLDLVILHGQRYLWHGLFTSLISLHDQLRDLRQELLAISQEFRSPESQAESATENGSWAFQNLLKSTWDTMLRKHRQALVARLDQCLRPMVFTDLLNESGTGKSQQTLTKASAESLRQAVRQELSGLLREIDLTGLLLNSDHHAADAPSPLKMLLEQAHPPLYATCGGEQRLLLVCPADAEIANFKQKIEKDIEISPSVAHTANHELLFCYEIGQVPTRQIAAYLLADQPDCREIAAKLQTRVDIRWPRDF